MAGMAKTLVCDACGKSVRVESFRMAANCPHCGRALQGEIALSTGAGARAVSWVLHLSRLVAAAAVTVFGIWLFCSLLWNPTGLIYFPCRTHRGTMMAVAGGGVLIGGFVAVHAAIRLMLRRGPATNDEREATPQG